MGKMASFFGGGWMDGWWGVRERVSDSAEAPWASFFFRSHLQQAAFVKQVGLWVAEMRASFARGPPAASVKGGGGPRADAPPP